LSAGSDDGSGSEIFSEYARWYDDLYRDKDYEAECDFVEALFHRHLSRTPQALLDVACGTGGHAIPLARRGYALTGVDLSTQMIELARQKAHAAGLKISFAVADMSNLALGTQFDAVLCMFASIGYMADAAALKQALRGMCRQLKPGGILVFDFWNGHAVAREYAPYKLKGATTGSGRRVTRLSSVTVDMMRQVCSIRLEGFAREGSQIVGEFHERHNLRFYFPQEMSHYIEESGLKLLQMAPNGEAGGTPTPSTWSITVVAQAPQ
jgi:ubiquinone/menaquinone biosynthesis C-methylase UbiE